MGKWRLLSGMALIAAAGISSAMPAYAAEKTIPDGIYVGDFSLGGLTKEEAQEEVAAYVDGLSDRKISLDVDGNAVETTARDLGYAWSNQDAVEEAASHAVEGNLIRRYMGKKDLEKTPVHIAVEAAVDEEKVDAFIRKKCAGIVGAPVDASIVRENGTFKITPGSSGKVVDLDATSQAIDEALTGGNSGIGTAAKTQDAQDDSAETEQGSEETKTAADPAADGIVKVAAVVHEEEPRIKEDDLKSIKDVLGTCTTDFSSSGAARSKNLANGAAKINGKILMPGDTLSGYECMSPFTTENGYFTAAAYENGQVVDSVGGGVCQIATTLYDASLMAELTITQRQNHSMIVNYVKPSMDAAIAGTYKDIKITNPYDTPIYIEGGTSGRTLTFTIYGRETRPANRKVEYISETISTTDPGAPQEKVDNTLAPGTRKQVQSAHTGLKSRLWKVVTVDGVEKERTILHTDTYNASKAIILVGPKAAAPQSRPTAPAHTETPAPETSGNHSQDHGGSTNSETTVPAQTEAQTNSSPAEGENAGPDVSVPAQTEAQTESHTQSHTEAPAPSPETPAASQSPVVEAAQ